MPSACSPAQRKWTARLRGGARGRLFSLSRTPRHVGALGDPMGRGTMAPDRHRASIFRGACLHALFQAAADRADLVQQNVAKFDLRHQRSLRRIAGGQPLDARFCGADFLQGIRHSIIQKAAATNIYHFTFTRHCTKLVTRGRAPIVCEIWDFRSGARELKSPELLVR